MGWPSGTFLEIECISRGDGEDLRCGLEDQPNRVLGSRMATRYPFLVQNEMDVVNLSKLWVHHGVRPPRRFNAIPSPQVGSSGYWGGLARGREPSSKLNVAGVSRKDTTWKTMHQNTY